MMRACAPRAASVVAAAAAAASVATVGSALSCSHAIVSASPLLETALTAATKRATHPLSGLLTHTRCLYAPSARTGAAATSLALGITKAAKPSTGSASRAARKAMVTADTARVATPRDARPKLVVPPRGHALDVAEAAEEADAFDEHEDVFAHDDLARETDVEAEAAIAPHAEPTRQKKSSARKVTVPAASRPSAVVTAAKDVEETDEPTLSTATAGAAASTLLNPFKGLHAHLSRSYRLDQLATVAAPNDILLARQEKKSTAFSFLRFASGAPFYQDHWASIPALSQEYAHHELFQSQMQFSAAGRGNSGAAVPGYTLFNNRLGLDNMRVQSSYPLLVAQRLLLFSDSFRHFHALCGRENVPCDFFADIDLPDVQSPAEGEKILLEVLNYLEVRLPGIGFTDPFFLILANEHMQSGRSNKIGYHIHARSMTYARERLALSLTDASKSLKHTAQDEHDNAAALTADNELDDGDDDLSDLVNVVDGDSGKRGAGSKKSKAASSSPATRLIAFQDYRTVKLLADEVNQTIGRTVIDEACYRANGMLRCAFSGKLKSKQDVFGGEDGAGSGAVSSASLGGLLMPLTRAKDKALQQKLTAMEEVLRTMSDPEILELSFCTRHLDTVETSKVVHKHLQSVLPPARSVSKRERLQHEDLLKSATRHRFKLVRPRHILGPQSAQSVEYDMYGNIVSPFLTEGAKWRRYKNVMAKLNDLPSTCATSYDIWVRIGLALHNFSNEDHVFEEWVKFSLRCPQKYSRESCRRKWVQFERNPDAQNWRRGFNYLNSTIWRQI